MTLNSRSMLLDILRYPDERLKRMSEPVGEVTDEIRKFVSDLSETMIARDGVGLAAPQVGVALRIFVLNDNGPRVFINPTIIHKASGEAPDIEGCLSFPGIFIKISRSPDVVVEAIDIDGNRFSVAYAGLLARAVQHETDHLNGRLMSDYMSYLKRQMVLKKIQKLVW